MVYVFLAEGFEEIEALTPVDILRRADIETKTVGIKDNFITGSHNITVACDLSSTALELPQNLEAIVLPGGMPGTLNLEVSKTVQDFIDYAYKNNILICAICAAPSILGHKDCLQGKKAVCFPGYEKDLDGAVLTDEPVVWDGNVITAKGMGVSTQFGLKIVEAISGKEKADNIKSKIQCV